MSLPAMAIPALQLDIGGGTYNSPGCSTDTTCAGSQVFTLYALYTPGGRAPSVTDTYYISAAVEPGITTPANLGSFTFNSTVVNVTSDMVFGTPSGLAPHGEYPTYFKEFSFTFSPGGTAATPYDVQTVVGTHTGPSGSGSMLYRQFTVDTTNLSSQVRIHFDLYHKDSSGNVDASAPASHDAESENGVPAPAVLSLLGMGLMLAGALRRRSRA